jgi:hypothetical protein
MSREAPGIALRDMQRPSTPFRCALHNCSHSLFHPRDKQLDIDARAPYNARCALQSVTTCIALL